MSESVILVAGAARSGTTALCAALANRPDVAFSRPKETHFLAFANMVPQFTGPGDDQAINSVAVTEPAEWRARLASARGRHFAEGSVSTLYYYDRSIPNIREYCPDPKVVLLLRDPAERAYSAYSYLKGRGVERLDFASALQAESDRIVDGYHHLWHYSAMSTYAAAVRAFLNEFGPERVTVLEYETFFESASLGVATLEAKLGLPHGDHGEAPVRMNASTGQSTVVRSLERLVRRSPLLLSAADKLPTAFVERVRSAGQGRPVVDDEIATSKRWLRARHAADVQELTSVLGLSAPLWRGYE